MCLTLTLCPEVLRAVFLQHPPREIFVNGWILSVSVSDTTWSDYEHTNTLPIVDQWSTMVSLPDCKNSNEPCDLDLWPIELEMIHNPSSPSWVVFVPHMNTIHKIGNVTGKDPWKYRSRSKVIVCDIPHASDHLCQIWKASIQNCMCFKADTTRCALF